jgi:phosphate transport system ATP-binding protein
MITIENFTCGYDDRTVWESISLEAHRGEITAIIAPSGEGKTTLLKAINRLHEVEQSGFWMRGSIHAEIDGTSYDLYDPSIDPHWLRRRVAYIFQSPVVLPMSIEANVAFGLKLTPERMKDTIEVKVRQALEEVALWSEVHDRLDQPASTLSLGQKQRLSIARALVLSPQIMLLDEPTSSLDDEATRRIEALMQRLKIDRTILLVSHDSAQVDRVADRVIRL